MITDDEMAARLFDGPTHDDAKRTIERDAIENELATPDHAAKRADAWGEVYSSLGLTATESQRLAGIKSNPAPELRAQWQEDSRKALRQDFGDDAGEALNDAKKYLSMHPKLRDHLSKTGLGDHPQWIRAIASKARAARTAGKLK